MLEVFLCLIHIQFAVTSIGTFRVNVGRWWAYWNSFSKYLQFLAGDLSVNCIQKGKKYKIERIFFLDRLYTIIKKIPSLTSQILIFSWFAYNLWYGKQKTKYSFQTYWWIFFWTNKTAKWDCPQNYVKRDYAEPKLWALNKAVLSLTHVIYEK